MSLDVADRWDNLRGLFIGDRSDVLQCTTHTTHFSDRCRGAHQPNTLQRRGVENVVAMMRAQLGHDSVMTICGIDARISTMHPAPELGTFPNTTLADPKAHDDFPAPQPVRFS